MTGRARVRVKVTAPGVGITAGAGHRVRGQRRHGRRRHARRVGHQDRHEPVLRQDEGRRRRAAGSNGATVQSFAGKQDGDNQTQVDAIENLISAGARGILITPIDSKAIVPSVDEARQAGLLVIALDTPLEPADAADATFATDNHPAELLSIAMAKVAADVFGIRVVVMDEPTAVLGVRESRAVLDLVPDRTAGYQPLPGGSPANTAVARPTGHVDVPALPVDIVDTVGAFMAGLLAAFDRDDLLTRAALTTVTQADLADTLTYAQRVAAVTCTRPGADSPWFEDLLRAEVRAQTF